MCNHIFNPTIRKDLSYCNKCGDYLKDNRTLLIKPTEYNNIIEIDAIDSLLTRISNEKIKGSKLNESSKNRNYLRVRTQGINQIRFLIQLLQFKQSIMYKAILYMDSIYSKCIITIEVIKEVAFICVLLAQQYNEKCPETKIVDLLQYLKTITFFKELEILCVQCLDYDLGMASAYDYLIDVFSIGITSKGNHKDINRLYASCFMFLEILITDDRFIDFSSYELAFTIIRCKCEESPIFALNYFESIFGMNYKEGRLMTCYFVLSIIGQVNHASFNRYNQTKENHYQQQQKMIPCRLYFRCPNKKSNSSTSCSTVDSVNEY